MSDQRRSRRRPWSAAVTGAVWKGLNSPFVLFLLSSVVVTGLTRFYTDRQAAIAAHQETRAQLAKLLLELQYRVSRSYRAARTLESFLNQMSQPGQYDDRLFQTWMRAAVSPIIASNDYQPASPEFARVHIAALLQQIDLRSGDLRAEQYPANGDESAVEAALALGDEQISALGNLPDAKRIIRRSLSRLRVLDEYLKDRKGAYLCDPSVGRSRLAQCGET